jgi:hypothetical protein
MSIHIEVSYGELIDKITILEIKLERIKDPAKLANIARELGVLNAAWLRAGHEPAAIADEWAQLKATNETLWDIEDNIRRKEASSAFDDEFIELARRVYHINDQRAAYKRAINDHLGSALVEEKSYQPY